MKNELPNIDDFLRLFDSLNEPYGDTPKNNAVRGQDSFKLSSAKTEDTLSLSTAGDSTLKLPSGNSELFTLPDFDDDISFDLGDTKEKSAEVRIPVAKFAPAKTAAAPKSPSAKRIPATSSAKKNGVASTTKKTVPAAKTAATAKATTKSTAKKVAVPAAKAKAVATAKAPAKKAVAPAAVKPVKNAVKPATAKPVKKTALVVAKPVKKASVKPVSKTVVKPSAAKPVKKTALVVAKPVKKASASVKPVNKTIVKPSAAKPVKKAAAPVAVKSKEITSAKTKEQIKTAKKNTKSVVGSLINNNYKTSSQARKSPYAERPVEFEPQNRQYIQNKQFTQDIRPSNKKNAPNVAFKPIPAESGHDAYFDFADLSRRPIMDTNVCKFCGYDFRLDLRGNDGYYMPHAKIVKLANDDAVFQARYYKMLVESVLKVQNPLNLAYIVPVSSVYFFSRDFMRDLAGAVYETGVIPSNIYIEISEDALLSDTYRAKFILNTVRRLGVKVSVSGFGKRFFEQASIPDFEIDLIRIAGNSVNNFETDAGVRSRIYDVLAYAGIRNNMVIATDVNSVNCAQLLKKLGCYLMQGPLSILRLEG